ncbi:hypothetical protein DV515_00006551, partial [Chloebia gouldiae]
KSYFLTGTIHTHMRSHSFWTDVHTCLYVSGDQPGDCCWKLNQPNLSNSAQGCALDDRHHISSAIPVPKRQSSSFGRLDIGFSSGLPSPDKGLRKRASTG